MCELLGFTANRPTDITASLKALAKRGSGESPHRDGWGVAFYDATSVQIYRDPVCIAESAIARALQDSPIKSQTLIAHIRQANVGEVSLPNTHPFTRELWDQHWTFAHNGQLKQFNAPPGHFNPLGQTDSESIFCDLLNQLRSYFHRRASYHEVIPFIAAACDRYRQDGPFNCLISNSEWLFAYCSTKLAFITRRLGFSGVDVTTVDTTTVDATISLTGGHAGSMQEGAVATVIATEPLTGEGEWTTLSPGQWRLWKHGELLDQGQTGP